jgi:integrase
MCPRKTFKKVITSVELIANINPKNKQLMDRFLREKNTRASDATITNYRSHLNIFFVWNLQFNDNKFFCDIKKIDFSEYFEYISRELRWGSSRFNGAKSCISSLSTFIEKFLDEDYPNFKSTILKTIESMPKIDAREKTILTEDQINGLFSYLEERKEYQIICWLALAIGSGSRFSELLRFKTDILNVSNLAFNDMFIETTKAIKTKGRSKSGKMLKKYILKDIFWNRYQRWLDIRNEILKKNGKNHEFIFIKDNGDPATEGVARGWVGKIETFLNVPFYPHSLRHFFCTLLSKSKLPNDLIQEIIGWSSEGMVKLYNDSSIKDRDFAELDILKKNLDKKSE